MKETEVSVVTRDDILELLERTKGKQNVSIYLPTHIKGDKVEQDPIRFKNLLKEAENKLNRLGSNENDIAHILSQAYDLLPNDDFWQHQNKGLAVFCAPDYFAYFRVPIVFEEKVNVGNRFIITPLIPEITYDGSYYVLALSKKDVRFIQTSRSGLKEIELEDMPQNYKNFMSYYVMQKQVQVHSGAPGRSSVYHGHGIGTDDERKHLENFVNKIENKVTSYLKNYNKPLILAGVDKITSLYRNKNQYNHLKEPFIKGNPDRKSIAVLNDEAWHIMRDFYREEMMSELARFGHLSDTTQTSTDIHDIIKSAYIGKIDTLFIAEGRRRWGLYDMSKNMVQVQGKRDKKSIDLFNETAIKTIEGKGAVYVFPKNEMPEGTDIAAIYRYPS
ncbi:MAG TPA: hypothetical protein VJ991_02765 [Balneolales bacterium]|nr:hypothetical protein [Balneolales bacterium]